MSYLIDSHCHIHDQSLYQFALSRQKKQTSVDFTPEKILARMQENNVRQAICIGTTHQDSLIARDFASQHTDIYWSYGIHPEEDRTGYSETVLPLLMGERVTHPVDASITTNQNHEKAEHTSQRAESLQTGRLVAIGEVGLDYHSDGYDRPAQLKLFEQMIDLAQNCQLPLIFHVRDAFDDFFAVLNNFHNIRGVVHSFSDSKENLEKALSYDFYIGVNGLATFADLPLPPLDKTILETDSPFLAPVPFRGKVNDPSHIKDIASWLANKYQVSLDEVADITTTNAQTLFKINEP